MFRLGATQVARATGARYVQFKFLMFSTMGFSTDLKPYFFINFQSFYITMKSWMKTPNLWIFYQLY